MLILLELISMHGCIYQIYTDSAIILYNNICGLFQEAYPLKVDSWMLNKFFGNRLKIASIPHAYSVLTPVSTDRDRDKSIILFDLHRRSL